MDEETLTLGRTEQKRAMVLNQVLAGLVTVEEAASLLGRSVRQVQRLQAAYRARGPAALVHGNRGRRPAWTTAPGTAARIVALAHGPYAGFNQQHFTEMLAEREGIRLSRSTVRRVLLAAGVAGARARRRPVRRARRERMAQEGMLVQADGSPHPWFGPEQPAVTLIAMIDDATSKVLGAVFREQEDGLGYLLVLERIVRAVGIPLALYVDRHGIFQQNQRSPLTIEEELAGGRAPTQVGRALGELGIRHIAARSPQAKGRVERLWGTLQGRLVAELAAAGVTTLAAANAFLPSYLERHNARFAVPPTDPGRAYLPVPASLNLAHVFCLKYSRVVRPDNTISFQGAPIQLLATAERRAWVKARVEVHVRLDGSRAVVYQGQEIPHRPAPADAADRRRSLADPLAVADAGPPPIAAAPGPQRPPAASHPWRQYRQDRR
jgi:transposase